MPLYTAAAAAAHLRTYENTLNKLKRYPHPIHWHKFLFNLPASLWSFVHFFWKEKREAFRCFSIFSPFVSSKSFLIAQIKAIKLNVVHIWKRTIGALIWICSLLCIIVECTLQVDYYIAAGKINLEHFFLADFSMCVSNSCNIVRKMRWKYLKKVEKFFLPLCRQLK